MSLNKAHKIKLNPSQSQKIFFEKSFGTARFTFNWALCQWEEDYIMNIGIYKLVWDNCPYYYYGSSIDLKRRKRNHINRLIRGKHENFLLNKIYLKYGIPSFEIVEYCDIDVIDIVEQKYLDTLKGDRNSLNLLYSVSGVGRSVSEETKLKISKSLSGRIFSEQHLRRLRFVNSGNLNPNFGKIGKNNNTKKVINNKTGNIYDNLKVASFAENINYNTLKNKLSGHRKNNTDLTYLVEQTKTSDSSDRVAMKQEFLFNPLNN